MDYCQLAQTFATFLQEQQGEEIKIYNVENKIKTTKRVVVCQKEKDVDAKKLAKQFLDYVSDIQKPLHVDGIFKGEWVVFDFQDVIVHIITEHTKQKYNIDKMYKECEVLQGDFTQLKF